MAGIVSQDGVHSKKDALSRALRFSSLCFCRFEREASRLCSSWSKAAVSSSSPRALPSTRLGGVHGSESRPDDTLLEGVRRISTVGSSSAAEAFELPKLALDRSENASVKADKLDLPLGPRPAVLVPERPMRRVSRDGMADRAGKGWAGVVACGAKLARLA